MDEQHEYCKVLVKAMPLIDGEEWDDAAKRFGYTDAEQVRYDGGLLFRCRTHGAMELRTRDTEERRVLSGLKSADYQKEREFRERRKRLTTP